MNFILIIYIAQHNKEHKSSSIPSSKIQVENDSSSYKFMNNPVDEYFFEHMYEKDHPLSNIEFKEYQQKYRKVWKYIYDDVMSIIRYKCIYEEDIAKYNAFINGVETYYDTMKPLLEGVMLDNFMMAESPEKHGYGNGTLQGLEMNKGMIYRDECIIFNQYMEEEYIFPDTEAIEMILAK